MPEEPLWIPDAAIEVMHAKALSVHGGSAGVRDPAMLASALARPRNQYAYGDPSPDLAALAAAYAFGISRNHPFVDGNKRTALIACDAFLKKNGLHVEAPEVEWYATFLALAEGSLGEDELAQWIREHLGK